MKLERVWWMCFGGLSWSYFFFTEIDTFWMKKAVKWCIAFVYLCNIVHVYFFYLCNCLWITEPCLWISDSLNEHIKVNGKSWRSQDEPRCFWFCVLLFFPPCRSECFIQLCEKAWLWVNGLASLIEKHLPNYMWIALEIILFIHRGGIWTSIGCSFL